MCMCVWVCVRVFWIGEGEGACVYECGEAVKGGVDGAGCSFQHAAINVYVLWFHLCRLLSSSG